MTMAQGASYAGLTFICWEILITLPEEVDYIWIFPFRFTFIKGLYLFSRYFALAVQINNAMVTGILRVRYPVASSICRLWLMYQAFVIYIMLTALNIILMIRVYALYNRRKKVGILLLFLLFCRIALSVASAAMTIPSQEFNPACLSEEMPRVVLYCFAVGEILLQSTILILTFTKQMCTARHAWTRTPLVSLLYRDGATTFTIICAVLIATIIYARFAYLHDTAHIIFPVFVCLISSAGCRIIINMQRLVIGTPHNIGDEFTSIIESFLTELSSSSTSQRVEGADGGAPAER